MPCTTLWSRPLPRVAINRALQNQCRLRDPSCAAGSPELVRASIAPRGVRRPQATSRSAAAPTAAVLNLSQNKTKRAHPAESIAWPRPWGPLLTRRAHARGLFPSRVPHTNALRSRAGRPHWAIPGHGTIPAPMHYAHAPAFPIGHPRARATLLARMCAALTRSLT